MELRRLLLRIMLLCLALAALGGVLAVITASTTDILARMVAIAISTAITVAVMIPFSFAIDKPSLRIGGFAGLLWSLGGFLLALCLIWDDFRSEPLAISLFAWTLCLLPAALLFLLLNFPRFRIAAGTGIVIGTLTFIMIAIPQWLHISTDLAEKSAGIAAFLGLAGFFALLSLINAGCHDRYLFRWLGILAALVLFAIASFEIWNDVWYNAWNAHSDFELTICRIIAAAASIAILIGIDNNARLVSLPGWQSLIRIATLAAAAACAVALNLSAAYDLDILPVQQTAAASGILAACGILSLAILARLNRRTPSTLTGSLAPLIDMAVICPRCSAKQKLKLNGAQCDSCHLKIDIRIEEPRCPTCNYLLYRLTSNRCPECGTPITAAIPTLSPPPV